MAAAKYTLVVLLVLCAAIAQAQVLPALTLPATTISKISLLSAEQVGGTVVITKSVTPPTAGVKYYATGILADLTDLQTFTYTVLVIFTKPLTIGKTIYPAGTISIVGQGTGPKDPTVVTKAIVGGTGGYIGVKGEIGGNGTAIVLTFK